MLWGEKRGRLEVHSCNIHLLSDGEHVTAEIVYWMESGQCFTIARWIRHSEGFNLEFIGRRPFNNIDVFTFMALAEIGQTKLEEYYNEQEKR